jgi:predicted ferric reductase
MGTILLSSVAAIRRRLYEIFLKFHLVLAAVVVAAIWFHNIPRKPLESPVVYLLASVCFWMLMVVLRFGQILYRNLRYGKPLNRAIVQTITFKRQNMRDIPISDAVHVRLTLSRPWNFRAGQFVYLHIPGVSRAAFMQSHPFYVSWWYRDTDDNYVVVFIIQRMRGFTGNIFLHSSNDFNQYRGMNAIIEGPYGRELSLESYGTVVLFATGIGIAGQLPYVKQLLEGYHNYEVKTRKWTLNVSACLFSEQFPLDAT